MQTRIPPLIIMILAILATGCITPSPPASQPSLSTTPTVAVPLSIQINASPSRYNPAMSSTIGIRLTPVNTSGIIPSSAQFAWATTFGSFYHWGPPDFKVVELGPEYTGNAEPVYWSYFAEHIEEGMQPVNITLTVRDPSEEGILAKASVKIGWETPSGLTAIVEG